MDRIKLNDGRELHIYADSFEVYSGGWRLFSFCVSSQVNTVECADKSENVTLKSHSDTRFVWTAENAVWDKKEYILEIVDGAFLFSIKVYGHAVLESIRFFRGSEDSCGSKFSVAGYLLLNSQNRDLKRSEFLMDISAELLPLRAAPPAYVLPFWNDMNDDIIGIGLAAKPGQHNFDKFMLQTPRNGWNENGCWFELPLLGYTEVNGEWQSQYIWGGFGADEMDTVREYSRWQYDNLGYERNITQDKVPEWWKGPMFCGWGQQCRLKNISGLKSPDYATQQVYQQFSDTLDEHGLEPTVIMIDDKWQENYGTLVPDEKKWNLREFVESQHEKGRHVLLWFKLWDTEGLPEDECIMLDGEPYAADPTNPKYIERLKKAIHVLLSDEEGCYNCDGFKLDFMDCFPRKAGAKIYEKGIFGLELMHRYFSLVYDFSKASKPDALINMSSVHPYFSSLCDQFRIHDYDPTLRNPVSIMKFRYQFASAVMPGVLVDMDGFTGVTKEETLRCFVKSAEIGVPDLYCFPEEFDKDDWVTVKQAWDKYSKQIERRI